MQTGLYPNLTAVDTAGWRWPHFTPQELSCRCGKFCAGEYWHDPAFLDALEGMRARLGLPLRINSARRCRLHNAAVGGAPLSQHRLSLAVDIDVNGWSDRQRGGLLREARAGGFTGFGYGRTFLHLDRRATVKIAQWEYAKGGMAKWISCL